jgi:hypothetical protein
MVIVGLGEKTSHQEAEQRAQHADRISTPRQSFPSVNLGS